VAGGEVTVNSAGRYMSVATVAVSVVFALATGASSAIGEQRAPLDRLPQIRNFILIGSNPLVNPPGSRMSASGLPRGMNAALGVAKNCAYVGSRNGLQDVLIVDISDPAHPKVAGSIPGVPLATSRELKALEDLDMLIVGHFALGAGGPTGENPTDVPGVVNNFRIYNISDCTRPVLRTEFDLGSSVWHEFFLWRDPRNPRRVLAYISFIGGMAVPDLRVWDLTDAQNGVQPRQVASFTLHPAVPASERVDPAAFDPAHFPFRATDLSDRVHVRFLFAGRFGPQPPDSVSNLLHSMSVSEDGTRVYMANLNAGFFILDSSNLADEARARTCVPNTVTVDATSNRDPNLCLRKLNPDPSARLDWHPPQPNITHTAVRIPGRSLVLVGDERNGTTTCPWAWYRIVDVSSEMNPRIVPNSEMLLPENRPENCRLGGPGDPKHLREFSSHNMTPFRNIGFVTWYSGGLRAWDYADPEAPREVGVFVPRPQERVQFPFRDSPDVWAWSYPVVRNGLIYFVDMRNGLYVVRYTGPRNDEVPTRGVFSGDMSPPFTR
jgi:hypothetical protein